MTAGPRTAWRAVGIGLAVAVAPFVFYAWLAACAKFFIFLDKWTQR